MNVNDTWPMYLTMLLAAIPNDPAIIQEVEELLHEYRGDLIAIAVSAHDQGQRCKAYHHISDALRARLEALAEPPDVPDVPPLPPEVPDEF